MCLWAYNGAMGSTPEETGILETIAGHILIEDEAYANAIEPILNNAQHIVDEAPVSDE